MAQHYPPVGFYFSVEFEGQSADLDSSFQEVSGLSRSVETEDYAEGGQNHFVHKLPKATRYDNLVLKRGIVRDSGLVEWFRKAMEDLDYEPKNVLVSLLNEQHSKISTWNVVHALPAKWSHSGMNAESSGLMIETMELTYRYFQYKQH
jgi:phage tail-like protein